MNMRIVMFALLCLFGLSACSGSSGNSTPSGPGANAPQISILSPTANDPSVAGALISATFDKAMNAATSASFVVYGSQTGILAGVYAGGGTTTLTFTPNSGFFKTSGRQWRVYCGRSSFGLHGLQGQ